MQPAVMVCRCAECDYQFRTQVRQLGPNIINGIDLEATATWKVFLSSQPSFTEDGVANLIWDEMR
jgi:hypothetical protein